MARSPRIRQILPLLVVPFLVVTTRFEPAEGFHSGGIGDCIGCHAMHRPEAGQGGARADNSMSLSGSDPGSTCLKCHQLSGEKRPVAHLIATADEDMPSGSPPAQLTPGGDFGWLKKSYRWGSGSGEGGGNSPGERHGHNIVAIDYRFSPDAGRVTAPGGSFPASRLSCISCHDPHGRYRRSVDGSIGAGGTPIQASGSYYTSPDPTGDRAVGVYRLLGGKGYMTTLYDGAPFTADPPAAVSPEEYNRPEEGSDTRVAYGKGMSEWCANCHPTLLGGSGGGKTHPAGNNVKFSAPVAANYNAYVGSGNLTGNSATSYSSMVQRICGLGESHGELRYVVLFDGSLRVGDGGLRPAEGDGVAHGRANGGSPHLLERHVPLLPPRPRLGVGPRDAMEHEDQIPGRQRGVPRGRRHVRSTPDLPGAHARGNAKNLRRSAADGLRHLPAFPLQQMPCQGLIAPAGEDYSSPNFFTWYRKESYVIPRSFAAAVLF
ncbi:MAG: cytochrome c [Deltaproteobacteria bacterium]|nr:cytochrome c [Deltaproteobacteria bacterium]